MAAADYRLMTEATGQRIAAALESLVNLGDPVTIAHGGTGATTAAAALAALGGVAVTDIVNNLTSTAANKPLSAAQGKALNDTISTITEQVIEPVGGYFTERSAFKARCTVSMMVIDSYVSITTQVPDNSSFGHVPAGFSGKLIAINVNTRACYVVGINANGDFVTLDNPLPVAYYYFVGAAMKTA